MNSVCTRCRKTFDAPTSSVPVGICRDCSAQMELEFMILFKWMHNAVRGWL